MSYLAKGMRVVLPMRRGVVDRVRDENFDVIFDDEPNTLAVVRLSDTWFEEELEPKEPANLREELERAVNKHSAENGSNTPDFILAEYLLGCLAIFNATTKRRDALTRDPQAEELEAAKERARAAHSSDIVVGSRVYHRRADLFGRVDHLSFRPGTQETFATVRYDPDRWSGPPVEGLPLTELVLAIDAHGTIVLEERR